MNLSSILNTEKKKLLYVSLGLISLGVFVNFIVTIVWWSRLHPWFSHGWKSGKTVYQSLTACWVFCLFTLIILIALVVFYFFVKSIYEMISNNDMYSLICLGVLVCFSFAIFISGMVPAGFGLKNGKDEDGSNMKCYQYVDEGMKGCLEWVESQSSQKKDDLKSYFFKLLDHILKDDESYTNYLCADVAAPTLIFCLFLLAGWGILIYIALFNSNENSINENKEVEQTADNNADNQGGENNA